jgi:hypothetical protein
MPNHNQQCPVCGAMTARREERDGELAWICGRGCDLTNYVNCEDCGELFDATRSFSSHCAECQGKVETAEYPVISG